MKIEQRANLGKKGTSRKRRKAAPKRAVDPKRRGTASRKARDGEQPLIANSELRLFHLPPSNGPLESVHRFALTYEGYAEAGSSDRCGDIANGRRWVTLHDLRTSLFFEQRRLRFVWGSQDDEARVDATMRDLVERIRSKLKWSERGTGVGKQVHRLDPEIYKRAVDFAANVHGDQKVPGSGYPYIVHVVKVAMEVYSATERDPDADRDLAVACALLHDTVEDAAPSDRPDLIERMHEGFGKAVASGVVALSKDDSIKDKASRMADSIRRIRMQPREVWLVKLGDRITNLEPPPPHWDVEKRQRYLQEARDILAALGDASPVMRERFERKLVEYETYCRPQVAGVEKA